LEAFGIEIEKLNYRVVDVKTDLSTQKRIKEDNQQR
jgi:hypothetical protein